MPTCLTSIRRGAIDPAKVLIGNKSLILKRISTYSKNIFTKIAGWHAICVKSHHQLTLN